MFEKIIVNYMDIIHNEQIVIDFLSRFSDEFSITVLIKKPYSQDPPIYQYCDQITPYATKFIYEKKDWPVDFLGQLKHQILVVCGCCKQSRKELLNMPNLFFSAECDVPEDICFYRDGKLWFATITHEKMAFMVDATKEDVAFFKENGIKIYD